MMITLDALYTAHDHSKGRITHQTQGADLGGKGGGSTDLTTDGPEDDCKAQ